MMIILSLADGTLRFPELRARIEGVSQKMLTQPLRSMESDGLISRTAYPTVPVAVDYALAPLGKSLSSTMDMVRDCAYSHILDTEAARKDYQARALAPDMS